MGHRKKAIAKKVATEAPVANPSGFLIKSSFATAIGLQRKRERCCGENGFAGDVTSFTNV